MIRAQNGAPCAVPQRRTREAWQPCQEDLGRLRTRQPLPVPALLKAETQFNTLNQACVSVRPRRSGCIFSGMQLSLAGSPTTHHLAASADLSTSLRSTCACADASAGKLNIHRPSQSSGQCSAAVVQSSPAGAGWGSAHVEPTAQLITLAMSHTRLYVPMLCFQRAAGRHQAACKSLRVSECDMLPSAGTCCRRPREHTYRLTTQIIFSESSEHQLCSAL